LFRADRGNANRDTDGDSDCHTDPDANAHADRDTDGHANGRAGWVLLHVQRRHRGKHLPLPRRCVRVQRAVDRLLRRRWKRLRLADWSRPEDLRDAADPNCDTDGDSDSDPDCNADRE
jgi:hypothetical protein